MLNIGTKVYYTGDIANHDGDFEVIAHRGNTYDLREIGGHNRDFLGVFHVADTYNGTCAERFVTQAARAAHRTAAIAEMERAVMRANYLKRERA